MWRIIDIQVVSLFSKTLRKQGRERDEKHNRITWKSSSAWSVREGPPEVSSLTDKG